MNGGGMASSQLESDFASKEPALITREDFAPGGNQLNRSKNHTIASSDRLCACRNQLVHGNRPSISQGVLARPIQVRP
jgi:hypothetical protein